MESLKEKVDKKQNKNKNANDRDFSEKEDGRNKVNKSTEKKRRRNIDGRNNVDGGDTIWISKEDDETKEEGEKKRNKLRKKKKRSGEQNNALVGKSDQLCAESEDGFNELKEWLTDYHQSRPGLKVLQQRLDEFIITHEEKLDQERKEREAQAAEGGWTVVKHHKGRKKTTDSESGITVGSVAPAAMENQTKKKPKEVGLEFYRFQKREAQKSEILALRSKFEEDRKRIQQLRAARKFRPY